MTKLLSVCYFLLSLYGCDVPGSTYVHRSSSNGNDTLHSMVVAQPGVARFECLGSASGQCHYTVFPRTCALSAARAPAAGCQEPIARFSIANGDSRLIPGLRRFRLCVSAQGATPGPGCDPAQPLASR